MSHETRTAHSSSAHPAAESLDIREHGALKNGEPQVTERRLYVQLQVFTNCREPQTLVKALEASKLESVLYLDVNDPRGLGVLFLSENASDFTGPVREL